MRTIWKHSSLIVADKLTVRVHDEASIVHVGLDHIKDRYAIWFDTKDTQEDLVSRSFRVYGTGAKIPDDANHVASFIQPMTEDQKSWSQGLTQFVWHLFELEYYK